MFKFNFGSHYLEDSMDQDETMNEGDIRILDEKRNAPMSEISCEEVFIDDLVQSLPEVISYSPLIIKSTTTKKSTEDTHPIILVRRDLYDARYQIISEDSLSEVGEDASQDEDLNQEKPQVTRLAKLQELAYIDAPSDVVPHVYEGGLKTWECSIDLVEHLSQLPPGYFHAKRILEVGCGTCLPTAYILQSLFNEDLNETPPTESTFIHVQDFNRSVLELVTLPNLILGWYFSKASKPYRETLTTDPKLDPSIPGDLALGTHLMAAFKESLHQRNVTLRFFAGSWATFRPRSEEEPPFDFVLTSETIYRPGNVPVLLDVLHQAVSFEKQTGPSSFIPIIRKLSSKPSPTILVAAKVLYFGVGGSVDEFEDISRRVGASVQTIQETKVGVGRRIMKVDFR